MDVGRFTGLIETCVVCAALQLLRGLQSARERGGLGRMGLRHRGSWWSAGARVVSGRVGDDAMRGDCVQWRIGAACVRMDYT